VQLTTLNVDSTPPPLLPPPLLTPAPVLQLPRLPVPLAPARLQREKLVCILTTAPTHAQVQHLQHSRHST
jgi:hypothetical protein